MRTQDLSRAIARFLSGSGVESANWAAAMTVAFCGLLRGAEFALQDGERFDSLRHLTRADVSFRRDESGREYVVLMMRPAKGKPGAAKTHPLLLGGGGSLLDPVAALRRLFALDPVAPEHAASTPLFRTRGAALTVAGVRDTVFHATLRPHLRLEAELFAAV